MIMLHKMKNFKNILSIVLITTAQQGFSSDLPATYSDYLNNDAVEACLRYESPSELVLELKGQSAPSTLKILAADSGEDEVVYTSSYRRNVRVTVRKNSVGWDKNWSRAYIEKAFNFGKNFYYEAQSFGEQSAQSATNNIMLAWNLAWNASSKFSEKVLKKGYRNRALVEGMSNHKHDSEIDKITEASCSRYPKACVWALGQVIREFAELELMLDPSGEDYAEKVKAVNCARIRAQVKHDQYLTK